MPDPAPPSHVDCALLVVSCDPYADLWPPFFALLRRHWPDCPFAIYLGAGPAAPAPAGVRMLRSNAGRDWSRCLMDYLAALPQRYVLLMLEDFFLRSPVSTPAILHCLRFLERHDGVQLRLIPRPKPTGRLREDPNIGVAAPDSPYRLSTQAAIWDRHRLLSLLREKESIWEFEINGNQRAAAHPTGFYSVWHAVLPYEGWLAHHVVEKGRWLPHERWIFGGQAIGCDFNRRATLSWPQTLLYHAMQTGNGMLNLLPLDVARGARRAVKTLLTPFLGKQFIRMRGVTPPRQ